MIELEKAIKYYTMFNVKDDERVLRLSTLLSDLNKGNSSNVLANLHDIVDDEREIKLALLKVLQEVVNEEVEHLENYMQAKKETLDPTVILFGKFLNALKNKEISKVTSEGYTDSEIEEATIMNRTANIEHPFGVISLNQKDVLNVRYDNEAGYLIKSTLGDYLFKLKRKENIGSETPLLERSANISEAKRILAIGRKIEIPHLDNVKYLTDDLTMQVAYGEFVTIIKRRYLKGLLDSPMLDLEPRQKSKLHRSIVDGNWAIKEDYFVAQTKGLVHTYSRWGNHNYVLTDILKALIQEGWE